jgi:small subunit ribosomal protein S13
VIIQNINKGKDKMARIAGINLSDNKQIYAALTAIYGINFSSSKKILDLAKIDSAKKVKDLTEAEVDEIRILIEKNYKVEGDLRSQVSQNVKRLKEIGTYRGERHSKNLPIYGQRTKTNARTKRGKKITIGSGRKKSADKT